MKPTLVYNMHLKYKHENYIEKNDSFMQLMKYYSKYHFAITLVRHTNII